MSDHVAQPDPYEQGGEVRRAVLGDAHVNRAAARGNDFNRPLQEYITRSAWGTVWARDGLDRRTRSAITVAITCALGRQDELALHVRGALRNGLSVDEISEILLHTAVYAGVPAALTGTRIAEAVLTEEGAL